MPRLRKPQLYSRTLKLLKKRPADLTIKKISNDTGISKPWLDKFVTDRIPDPGVNRVETLYTYLSQGPLFKK